MGTESGPRTFSGWPGQGPFLSMRSYLGQRACKAGRPQRPHKAHSAQPLFTHLLSPRAHTTATPAQRLSPSFDVQEQKTAIKCCFKEGVLTALPSVKRKRRPEGEGRGEGQRPGEPQRRDPEKKGMPAEEQGQRLKSKPNIFLAKDGFPRGAIWGEEKERGTETQRPGGTSKKIMREDKIRGIERDEQRGEMKERGGVLLGPSSTWGGRPVVLRLGAGLTPPAAAAAIEAGSLGLGEGMDYFSWSWLDR